MSDNTKLKKAARERQRATGERYTTARLHVLRGGEPGGGRPPSHGLRRVVDRIIDLSAGPEAELEAFLEALDPVALRKVEVLTYAGRDEGGVLELERELPRDSHAHTVDVIAGKVAQLAGYLREGLAVAAREGVDLDGVWARRARGTWVKAPGSDFDRAIDGMLAWSARRAGPRYADGGEAAREAWAAGLGVTPTRGHACLLGLVPEAPAGHKGCVHLPGDDHTTVWDKDGVPFVYVTQPYNLDQAGLEAMFRVARRLGLTIHVDRAISWHDPGAVLIEVVRA